MYRASYSLTRTRWPSGLRVQPNSCLIIFCQQKLVKQPLGCASFRLAPKSNIKLIPLVTMSAPPFPVPAFPPLDSTYGVWLVSLFLETMLYGMGVLQTWIYFAGRPQDSAFIKFTVFVVLILETVQAVFFFFRSSYFRFVLRFGILQTDLIWEDSLQLLAAYLGAFAVQIFFATRVYKLTQGTRNPLAKVGMYTIFILAFGCMVAGIAQTAWSYHLRSYLKLGDTKAVTTVQSAASLACDLLITIFLCVFLTSQKGDIKKTNYMMDRLIYEAINRGTLTALASGVNLVLFLALPDTFWFFIGLAPSSKLYMNSMLATLNTRQHIRNQIASVDKGWNTIPMGSIRTTTGPVAFKSHHVQGHESTPNLDEASIVKSMVNGSFDNMDEAPGLRVKVEQEVYVR
ncbi:hypothetical protein C8F01DRAFT_122193 [Mycena amicta]|nr:hypothetical protein C8F01DRAFT_122193 [Mycena amicta]